MSSLFLTRRPHFSTFSFLINSLRLRATIVASSRAGHLEAWSTPSVVRFFHCLLGELHPFYALRTVFGVHFFFSLLSYDADGPPLRAAITLLGLPSSQLHCEARLGLTAS